MRGHAEKCAERYCEMPKEHVSSLQQVATPCTDDHLMRREDYETTGGLSVVCAQLCPEMLVLGKNWTTKFMMVSKYSEIDKLHQSNQKLQAKSSVHIGNRFEVIANLVYSRQCCHLQK